VHIKHMYSTFVRRRLYCLVESPPVFVGFPSDEFTNPKAGNPKVSITVTCTADLHPVFDQLDGGIFALSPNIRSQDGHKPRLGIWYSFRQDNLEESTFGLGGRNNGERQRRRGIARAALGGRGSVHRVVLRSPPIPFIAARQLKGFFLLF
jgi:hypothetical protein